MRRNDRAKLFGIKLDELITSAIVLAKQGLARKRNYRVDLRDLGVQRVTGQLVEDVTYICQSRGCPVSTGERDITVTIDVDNVILNGEQANQLHNGI